MPLFVSFLKWGISGLIKITSSLFVYFLIVSISCEDIWVEYSDLKFSNIFSVNKFDNENKISKSGNKDELTFLALLTTRAPKIIKNEIVKALIK